MTGEGHLHQHDGEEKIFIPELQLGEGVPRHGAEHHRADNAEENHQAGVYVKVHKGEACHYVAEVFEGEFLGEDGWGNLHTLRHRFGAGEDHPDEGEDHHDGAKGQESVGEDFDKFFGSFQ